VSPLTTREVDAATRAIRATWGGRARVVRVPSAEPASAPASVRVEWHRGGAAATDDALAAAVALGSGAWGPSAGRSTKTLVVRDGPTPADLAWEHDSAGVLVDWPADGAPRAWGHRAQIDTAGAVA